MSLEVVGFLSAEIVLVVAALAIYLGGAFSASQKVWAPLALGAIVLAAMSLASYGGNERYLQHAMNPHVSPVIADPLSAFGRWFALGVGAVMVLMAWRPLATGGTPEYLGSLLLIVAGLMLVASAANLVLLFVGLELVSIPTYILLSLGRRDPAGQEAAAKYFYLSVLASAISALRSEFPLWNHRLHATDPIHAFNVRPRRSSLWAKWPWCWSSRGFASALRRCRSTFTPRTFIRVRSRPTRPCSRCLPKAAGLLALVRLVVLGMPDMGPYAWKIFLLLSILTMTLGNVLALWQENVRRLFAYSSIANAGYMLIGLAVAVAPGTGYHARMVGDLWDGIGATFFYLCVYAAATLGTFAVFAYLGRQRQQVETVEELAGLGRTHPAMAAALAVCMFSLAGLPPAAGLWGKLMLFGSALNVQDARRSLAAVVHRAGRHRRVECGGGGLLLSPHRQPDVLSRTAGRAAGRRRPRRLRRGVAMQLGRTGVVLLSPTADERVRRGREERGAGNGEQGTKRRKRRVACRKRGAGSSERGVGGS